MVVRDKVAEERAVLGAVLKDVTAMLAQQGDLLFSNVSSWETISLSVSVRSARCNEAYFEMYWHDPDPEAVRTMLMALRRKEGVDEAATS